MNEFFSGAHVHLLVNHTPIIGAFFALGLLIASYFFAADVLRRTAFVVLVGIGFAAAAANYSGDPAEDAIRGYPGVSRTVIHEHEDIAKIAFRVAVIVGILSLGALVRWRRVPLPQGATAVVLLGAVIVSGLMAYAGLLGGRVRHTEVRPGAVPGDAMIVEPPRTRPPGPRP